MPGSMAGTPRQQPRPCLGHPPTDESAGPTLSYSQAWWCWQPAGQQPMGAPERWRLLSPPARLPLPPQASPKVPVPGPVCLLMRGPLFLSLSSRPCPLSRWVPPALGHLSWLMPPGYVFSGPQSSLPALLILPPLGSLRARSTLTLLRVPPSYPQLPPGTDPASPRSEVTGEGRRAPWTDSVKAGDGPASCTSPSCRLWVCAAAPLGHRSTQSPAVERQDSPAGRAQLGRGGLAPALPPPDRGIHACGCRAAQPGLAQHLPLRARVEQGRGAWRRASERGRPSLPSAQPSPCTCSRASRPQAWTQSLQSPNMPHLPAGAEVRPPARVTHSGDRMRCRGRRGPGVPPGPLGASGEKALTSPPRAEPSKRAGGSAQGGSWGPAHIS